MYIVLSTVWKYKIDLENRNAVFADVRLFYCLLSGDLSQVSIAILDDKWECVLSNLYNWFPNAVQTTTFRLRISPSLSTTSVSQVTQKIAGRVSGVSQLTRSRHPVQRTPLLLTAVVLRQQCSHVWHWQIMILQPVLTWQTDSNASLSKLLGHVVALLVADSLGGDGEHPGGGGVLPQQVEVWQVTLQVSLESSAWRRTSQEFYLSQTMKNSPSWKL